MLGLAAVLKLAHPAGTCRSLGLIWPWLLVVSLNQCFGIVRCAELVAECSAGMVTVSVRIVDFFLYNMLAAPSLDELAESETVRVPSIDVGTCWLHYRT